jgi:CRP-like cAMP-binding protein/HEAT repeat protein
MRIASAPCRSFLGKLLNIRSGEWRRLSILYAMSLVALTSLNWSDAIVQAAFLQHVGVQYLPWVIISCAACSIVALFIYFAFADRVSNTRILIGLFVISAVGILLGLAALAAGLIGPAYLLLYLVLQVPLLDVYNVHWATYVNGFYDIRTAKRIVPVLATTARLAGISAGFSMPLMNRLLSPAAIIVLSVVGLAVTGTLAILMPRWMHEQRADRAGRPRSHVVREAKSTGERQRQARLFFNRYAANLREGYQQIRGSPFLLAMALSTLSMTILLALLNYRTSAIFLSELKTTVAISDFVGVLTGVANLIVLPFQLFVLSRLIARLGLGNASLIYPLVSLATAGSLVAAPGLTTAALGYLDRTAFRTAFRIPTDNLLYNAVPQRVKARTRAFVGGLVVPIGAIVGGLLLLTPMMRTSWFLPAAILLLAIALTAAGLSVRRHYGKALVDLLEQEDYSSLALQVPSEQGPSTLAADPTTLARLGQKLDESTSPERILFMAQLITAVGGEAAIPFVGQAARATQDSRLRALLVDVLVAADVRRGGARELYGELLSDPDARVRLSAVSGLEQIDGPRDRLYLEVAAHLLADPDIDVRLRVLPALMAAGDPLGENAGHAAASAELRALLKSPDPHTRARAVRVIGQARAFGFLMELVRSLTDADDEVRLAAGLATEALASDELLAGKRDMLLALALLLMHDPVERARVSALTVLDWLSTDSGAGASAARESSVAGLADRSPEVRERAVEILVRAGRRALPPVREQLNAADGQQRKMAAVVLARIDPRKYSPLVLGATLNDNLRAIYQNLACLHALAGCPGPAVQALGSALRERNAHLLDEIFYLLTAIQDPDAVETIARSLRSSQPAMRANAVEALESLTTPQTAALVGPLLEPDRPTGPPSSLARQTWELSVPTPVDALRLLLSDASDAWQRTLAAAALAELSMSVDRHSVNAQSQAEIAALLERARADPDEGVQAEVGVAGGNQSKTLSLVGRLVILKELPFFRGMRIEQLRALAAVCDEQFFPADTRLFNEGDLGGVLYAVVSGRVGVEQEKRRGPSAQRSFARLATVEARSYLGESEFFDGDCRTHSAHAIEDTLTLKLRREPLIALARQNPDLSLELINVLSDRLREANERIAELTRTEPERLLKLYDELE